jgi:hypothetical protein
VYIWEKTCNLAERKSWRVVNASSVSRGTTHAGFHDRALRELLADLSLLLLAL